VATATTSSTFCMEPTSRSGVLSSPAMVRVVGTEGQEEGGGWGGKGEHDPCWQSAPYYNGEGRVERTAALCCLTGVGTHWPFSRRGTHIMLCAATAF